MKLGLVHPLLARCGCASAMPGPSRPWGRTTGLWPSCEVWGPLVLLKMAAGTWLLFLLMSGLDVFVLVTWWGSLILTQRLPRYTSPGSLPWGPEEKPVI